MFARFDENPAMTLQDIKETKRYGRTHPRTDNVKTVYPPQTKFRERSGSVVESLTRDRRAAGSSLTGVTALWSLSKTHLLMGRKESNQTNKQTKTKFAGGGGGGGGGGRV